MGCKLRMSAEIADWLGDLRESDPTTATEVGAALLAVMAASDVTALAFVTSTNGPVEDPREQLDHAYQRLLKALQQIRRMCAEAATRRKRLELVLGDETALAEPARATLEAKLAAARRREDMLTARSQRLQAQVEAFWTQKEVAKAVATATQAQQAIRDVLRAAGMDEDDADAEAVGDDSAKADEELARAERLLESVTAAAGLRPRSPRASDSDPQVLELQADPLGTDVRILFGTEPSDTITLLAVLEGEHAISEHRDAAIDLAADLLADIRRDGWSTVLSDTAESGPEFADPAAFLAGCFPSQAGAVTQRAAVLARAVSLRGLRGGRDLAEAARSTGMSEDRLRRIERHGMHGTTVGEAAAYVRGLGGRLELTVVIDGEPHVLAR
jgi:phage shock protein A